MEKIINLDESFYELEVTQVLTFFGKDCHKKYKFVSSRYDDLAELCFLMKISEDRIKSRYKVYWIDDDQLSASLSSKSKAKFL